MEFPFQLVETNHFATYLGRDTVGVSVILYTITARDRMRVVRLPG